VCAGVGQWFSPLSWAVRSIAQNEFYSKDYDNILPNGVRAGTFYLDSYDIYLSHGWKWAGVGYLAFFYLFSLFLCVVALKYIAKQQVRKSPHIEDPNNNVAPTLRVTAAAEAIKHVKSRPSSAVQHEDSTQSGEPFRPPPFGSSTSIMACPISASLVVSCRTVNQSSRSVDFASRGACVACLPQHFLHCTCRKVRNKDVTEWCVRIRTAGYHDSVDGLLRYVLLATLQTPSGANISTLEFVVLKVREKPR
jgi:hypothetical protein